MFAQQHVQFVRYLLIFRIRFDLPNTEDTIRERPGKREGVGNFLREALNLLRVPNLTSIFI